MDVQIQVFESPLFFWNFSSASSKQPVICILYQRCSSDLERTSQLLPRSLFFRLQTSAGVVTLVGIASHTDRRALAHFAEDVYGKRFPCFVTLFRPAGRDEVKHRLGQSSVNHCLSEHQASLS